MNLQNLKTALAENPDQPIAIKFADGSSLAPHFHITEIGKVTKDFVDCGGTRRQTQSCMLQTLVADDTDHRLVTTKLAGITQMSDVLELDGSVEVEAEVQTDTIAIYSVESAGPENGTFVFKLAAKNTACLAPDKCGIEAVPISVSLPTAQVAEEGGCCGGSSNSGGGG